MVGGGGGGCSGGGGMTGTVVDLYLTTQTALTVWVWLHPSDNQTYQPQSYNCSDL